MAMEISHGNFQVQNLRGVIQTTIEISMVNISIQLSENDGVKTLVDTNDDGNFHRQNPELIQNDD